MRYFLVVLIFSFGIAGAFDAVAYKGRHSDEVWQDFKSKGHDLSSEIEHWLDTALRAV